MSRGLRWLLSAWCLYLTVQTASAAEVEALSPRLVLEASGRATLAFRVQAEADLAATGARLDVPEGWVVVVPDDLGPPGAEPSIRMMVVQAPAYVGAGTYPVTLILFDGSTDLARATTEIEIAAHSHITVSTSWSAPSVLVGDSATCTILVSNTGNTRESVVLELQTTGLEPVESQVLTLAPGERHMASIGGVIESPGSLASVRAMVRDRAGAMLEQSLARLEVLHPSEPVDRYRRMEGGVAAWGLAASQGGDTRFGGQIGAHLTGHVDAGKKTFLDLTARGPDARFLMDTTGYSEYRLVASTEKGVVKATTTLGDAVYRVSQLTEYTQLGRGGTATLDVGGFHASAWTFKNRFRASAPWQLGGQVGFRAKSLGSWNLTVWNTAEQGVRGTIMSHDGTFLLRLAERAPLQIRYEIAQSDLHPAAMLAVMGSAPTTRYWAFGAYGSPDYVGEYRDRLAVRGGLAQRVGRIRLSATGAADWIGTTIGTPARQRTTFGQAAAGYALPRAGLTQVTYRFDDRRGARSNTIHRGEWLLSSPIGPWSLGVRTGARFLAGPTPTPDIYAQLGGLYRARHWRAGATLSGSTNRRLQAQAAPYGALDLSWQYATSRDTQIYAGWTLSLTSSDGTLKPLNTLRTAGAFELPWHHRLLWSVRASLRSSAPTSLSARLGYEIPFQLRVGKRPDIAIVSGLVQDEAGAPLAGLPVTLGRDTVTTDRLGRFEIEAEPGSTPTLMVRSEYLDGSWISVGDNPRVLALDPWEGEPVEHEVTVTLARAAALDIQVTGQDVVGSVLRTDDSEPEFTDRGPLVGVRLVLVKDDVRMLAFTDHEGIAHLQDLEPGDWSVWIDPRDLPRGHLPDQDRMRVTLEPSDHLARSFVVRPVVRRIQFMDVGILEGFGEPLTVETVPPQEPVAPQGLLAPQEPIEPAPMEGVPEDEADSVQAAP